jgi:hypothetical protein
MLIAVETTARHARAIKPDPGYGDVIVERWQRFTGWSATLDGGGRSYDQIAPPR